MIRVYGKHKTDKKFRPFDATNGKLVGNLIYATVWTKEHFDQVAEMVNELNQNNPEYTFEIRCEIYSMAL